MSEFTEIVNKLQEGQSALVTGDPNGGDNLAVFVMDFEKLNELLSDDNFIFAFTTPLRKQASLFVRYLELKYFHPNTEKNDLLLIIYHKWQDMVWTITGVPRRWEDPDGTLHDGEDYMLEAISYAGMWGCSESVPILIGDKGYSKPKFNFKNILYLQGKPNITDLTSDQIDEKIREVEKTYLEN